MTDHWEQAKKRSRRKRKNQPSVDPNKWWDLACASDQELAATDVALVNLACAAGLSGSEGLNLPQALDELDRMAARVKREARRNRHKFARESQRYGDSPAEWTAGMLVTVLQQDYGVRYNPHRIRDPDFPDSRDLFLHGMLGRSKPGGTCVSMPFLYVSVGRRLGYPMYIASAKGHLFVRWDDPEGTRWRESDAHWKHPARFNLEGAATGFHIYSDEFYYRWPMPMTPDEIASNRFL